MCSYVFYMDERNLRQFPQRSRPAEVVLTSVVEVVRAAIATWRQVPNTKANWELALDWKFSTEIFGYEYR